MRNTTVLSTIACAVALCCSGCGDFRNTMDVVPDRMDHVPGDHSHAPGQIANVRLPGRGEEWYTVTADDSLTSIAKGHGVTLDWLIHRNNIQHTIKPGDNLVVPARSTGVKSATR